MSISKLPSGRWRAQVHHPGKGHNVTVASVLGPQHRSFATKREAKAAREQARAMLSTRPGDGPTIAQWRDRWISDPLFARPKLSTNMHNAERTKAFADRYANVPLTALEGERGDAIVAEWLDGGNNTGTVQAIRAMLNDAASGKAGRLLRSNPFSGLGIGKGKGNAGKQPPSEEEMETLLRHARDLTPPSFAAYLEFACCTAARPGELDALRFDRIDLQRSEVDIAEQWNVKTGTFTTPKYGPYTMALVGRARDVVLDMKRDRDATEFVFTTLRGTHYTPSSRTHHWNRVRAAAGLGHTTLYLATRHYFAWYALNVLELDPRDIAEQLGHKDGGKLIIKTYGHPDQAISRRRLRDAYDRHGNVIPLRVTRKDVG